MAEIVMPESKILRLPTVYHVGDLERPRGLRSCLYASAGLFVSLHPEAWTRIAKLGGFPTWAVTRRDGAPARFVDWLRLPKKVRTSIISRAVDFGLVSKTTHFQYEHYDDEWEETFIHVFETREEAEAEAEDYEAEVTEVPGYAPSEELLTRWRRTFKAEYELSASQVIDFAVEVVLEHETDLDGIWWSETLDASRLSAPQGVVFESALPRFRWEITSDLPCEEYA